MSHFSNHAEIIIFWLTTALVFRESTIKLLGKDHISSNEKLLASSIAGALGGGVSGALFR